MAENHPEPPAGFQRPGIPGAGNILDPATRGELREKLQAAVPQVLPLAVAAGAPNAAPGAAPAQAETAPPAPAQAASRSYRAGPFPHGDVDLRGFAANVPPGPVRPQRGPRGRRFYFLPSATANAETSTPEPAAGSPLAPKPG